MDETMTMRPSGMPLLVAAILTGALAAAPAVAATHLFYSDASEIHSFDLATSASQLVLASSSGYQPLELRTDQPNGHVYFHSGTSVSATIQRIDFDGYNSTQVYQGGPTHTILNLALDAVNQQLYDSEPGGNGIARVNTDGTGLISFVSTPNPNGLEVDPVGGKLYYAERMGAVIRRIDLNGTGLQTVISPSTDPGVVDPWTISLDVGAGKLYFGGVDQGDYHIQRSNLDGTGFEDLLTLNSGPRALRVDEQAGVMYWAEGPLLRRANLDGTGAVTLLTHTSNIYGITMVTTTVPEPSSLLFAVLVLPSLALFCRRKNRRRPGAHRCTSHQ